jgi:hypothetical protein
LKGRAGIQGVEAKRCPCIDDDGDDDDGMYDEHTKSLGGNVDTVAIIRFKHEKNLVLKGKQNVKYKSNCNKPFIVEIQFSTKAERKFKI